VAPEHKNDQFCWRNAEAACSHEYLIPSIKRAIDEYRQGEKRTRQKLKIFDAGCGNGYLARYLINQGFSVDGCDISESGIKQAESLCPEGRFELLSVYDNFLDRFTPGYDLVILSEVIEHLYSPRIAVQRAKELLRPGGLLIITTPYHSYLKNLLLALTGKLDPHFTVLWDGGHIKFWSRKTISQLLQEFGFCDFKFFNAGRLAYLWKSLVVSARKPE